MSVEANAKGGALYKINVEIQHFPLKSVFKIARGAKIQADVIVVTIIDGTNTGWAESFPYGKYEESVSSVKKQILLCGGHYLSEDSLGNYIQSLPTGAAKNQIDCALLDLKAKQQNSTVSELLSLSPAQPCVTAKTLSIDTSEAMAKAARLLENLPLVKVKLDNENMIEKMATIHLG